jgi:hypothetical protein
LRKEDGDDDIIALFSNALQRGDQRASFSAQCGKHCFIFHSIYLSLNNIEIPLLHPTPPKSPLPLPNMTAPAPAPQPSLPTKSNIQSSATLITPYIHRTPLLTCSTLDRLASTALPTETHPPTFSLYFKAESLQKIGAFKARGAFHALIRLIERLGLPEVQQRGVVTHSSGNHAQALALASSTLGVKCTIVMPSISTESKIAGTRVYCQDVRFSGSTSVEREEVVRQVIEESGAILIPPYDHCELHSSPSDFLSAFYSRTTC